MPVEITILSGQQQGRRIEVAGSAFEVGDLPTDAVCFDSVADPEMKGRRASLRVEDGAWRIRSTGDSPIIVNHDLVERGLDLRSGDIVRMSESGPDFAFTLINQLSAIPIANLEAAQPAVSALAPTATEPSQEVEFEAKGQHSSFKMSMTIVTALVAILCVLVFAVMFGDPKDSDVAELPLPTLTEVAVLIAEEGKEFIWQPRALETDGVEELSFVLSGNRPEGMTLDRKTGEVRWTPTEQQAPGEYQFQLNLHAADDSRQRKLVATIVCQAMEINQAPTLNSNPVQTLDLLQRDSLDVTLNATDSDLPTQSLKFQLGADAPSDMLIDVSTGRVTWTPNRDFANKLVTVTVIVTDDGNPAQTALGELRVSVIESGPWDIAADEVRQSLYLVGVQSTNSKTMLPLGTACAINADTLLTSATVATGLQEGRERGWKVVAIRSTMLHDFQTHVLQITDLMAHVGSVASEDMEQQLFFDLGLLKVNGRFETSCQLATAESLSAFAAEPQPLACIGFGIDGGLLARFDLPEAELKRVDLYSMIALPGEEVATVAAPPLLQLSGEVSNNPFGSPIILRDGSVVGIYAIRADLPKDAELQHVHYAPVVTLVSGWLAGEGQSHWIEPKPAQATPATRASK
ncbi:MAG: putative Ig domain-containing protein [Planctomycetes bacterium]|nr:putative Ig domain-containing protein [Planctomycetota bacterium]